MPRAAGGLAGVGGAVPGAARKAPIGPRAGDAGAPGAWRRRGDREKSAAGRIGRAEPQLISASLELGYNELGDAEHPDMVVPVDANALLAAMGFPELGRFRS